MKHVLRNGLMALGLVIGSVTSATAQVSVGVWLPGVSIGINLPVYPQLVAVPGYPVYYAPQLNSNYFFYDGMYWVYQSDNWYASSWYNGPWGLVGPQAVPVFLLRVPVRYYRVPPPYFRGWQADRPPHWDEHWGNEWKQRRGDWDRWDRRSVPPRAPLPTYQRQYSGNKYPQQLEQQVALQGQKYKYKPRDAEVRPYYESQRQQVQGAPARSQQRDSSGPRQEQAQPRATQPYQQQQPAYPQQQRQQQPPAPRPPEPDRGSQGKGSQGSQDRGSQGQGAGHSSAPGQYKDGGKGEQGGGDYRK
jgi:hypothetical protein